MNVNISGFELRKHENSIQFRVEKEGMEYPECFYMLNEEIPLILSCLKNESKFHPSFHDGYNLVRFHAHGISVIKLNKFYYGADEKKDGEYKETEFVFPGKEVAKIIEQLECLTWDQYPIGEQAIKRWVEDYSPKVKFVFAEGVEEKLHSDYTHELVSEPIGYKLEDNLYYTAINSSDGNLIEIHIQFDSWKNTQEEPSNYYWYLFDTETQKTFYNGGFIAHRQEKDGKVSFSYATHT